jgi:hypothetical protein
MITSRSRKSDLIGRRRKERVENTDMQSKELLEEDGNRCLSKIIQKYRGAKVDRLQT